MGAAVIRHPFFVRAPAELGRLQAFGNKTFHRPGVDEHVHWLRPLRALGVAFGDMDALDAELVGKLTPAFAALRLVDFRVGVAGDVEQRLLDEPGHHSGIGAAGGDRGRAAGILVLGRQQRLAQRVVRALFGAGILVEVEAEPGLDDGVDVERTDLAAQRHDVDGGGVDREVDAKALAAAGGQQRHQQLAIIVLGDRLLDEADAMLFGELAVLMRIDDHEARLVVGEMPLDQRQCAFSDRAEADHDNGARNFRVDLRGGAHQLSPGGQLSGWGVGVDQGVRRFAVTSISTFISGFRRPATTSSVAAGRMSPRNSPHTAKCASASLTSVR